MNDIEVNESVHFVRGGKRDHDSQHVIPTANTTNGNGKNINYATKKYDGALIVSS